MASRDEITETIKARFAHVKERGRILARALKVRADIAAVRRRLRAAFAELGEEVYERMLEGTWEGDETLQTYKARIEGVKAELRQREEALRKILEEKGKENEESEPSPAAEDEA